jgi:hypothetical protein
MGFKDVTPYSPLAAWSLVIGLCLDRENGCSKCFQYIGQLLPGYTASHPTI